MNINGSLRPKLHILKQPHQYVHRTQQNSPLEGSHRKIKFSNPKQFSMPAVNHQNTNRPSFGTASKIIRSLHNSKELHSHSKEKQSHANGFKKNPIFDINILKNSMGHLDRDAILQYASGRRKLNAPKTNRIVTEKKVTITEGNDHKELSSQRDKKISKSKITYRLNHKAPSLQKTEGNHHGGSPKSNRNNYVLSFPKQQKIQINERSQSQNSKPLKHQKKLTPFEKQQTTAYEIFYVGPRRIYSKSDFTDSEGDPKVMIHDSIAYRYQIIAMFGRGSFGKVFKAFDHKKKEYVALKLIKSQKKFLDQAKIEVEILQSALLQDPKLRCNVVRMKGSFVFRGHSCITFEILHKNLYQFLKEHHFSGFSHDLIRRFAIQVLQALFFFKNNKIIHCDLKPQNIMLKQENKSGIKVIDVGSGCFEEKQIYTYIQSRFYRAPQIILGVRYTPAIDMWSFGCILSQLFNGFPLFPGESENQQMLMFMQLRGLPPSNLLKISERRKKFFTEQLECKIPQEKGKQRIPSSVNLQEVVGSNDPIFIDLIEKCLEWDPEKRIKPGEALLHQWILKGLPQEIRQQHIQQMKEQIDLK